VKFLNSLKPPAEGEAEVRMNRKRNAHVNREAIYHSADAIEASIVENLKGEEVTEDKRGRSKFKGLATVNLATIGWRNCYNFIVGPGEDDTLHFRRYACPCASCLEAPYKTDGPFKSEGCVNKLLFGEWRLSITSVLSFLYGKVFKVVDSDSIMEGQIANSING
jgi:hypothetical protein